MRDTKFIVLASGKGGSGKTTTALNLGCALANFGKEVLLIDANLTTPHLGVVLGSPLLPNTLNKVLAGSINIKDSTYMHPSGLKIILSDLKSEAEDFKNLKKIKNVLIDLRGTADMVLIDSCAGLGEDALHTLTSADELIVVTNPELPAVSDAFKLIKKAEERGIKILGVVVNRVTGEKSSLTTKNIEAFLEKPVICEVPEDVSVRQAISAKQPVVYSHPNSPAAVGFKKLAAKMMGQNYEPEVKHISKPGILDKIIGAVNKINSKIDKK